MWGELNLSRRAPAYINGGRAGSRVLTAADVDEGVPSARAGILNESAACHGMRVVAFDGKTLRGSFDKFTDTRPCPLGQRLRRR